VFVWAHGKSVPAQVVSSVFVDKEGVRQHA